MGRDIQNHNQMHRYGASARKLTLIGFKHIGSTFAIALAFLFLISCSTNVQKVQNSVLVSGTGTVFVQPDMVQINVNFSHTAATTGEAKKVVDETMQRILKILQDENIEDKFIKTVSLNYDIEYEYRNGQRVKIGQRAQQSIVVTVNDIVNKPERFPSLLDKITAINKVEISNIQFDIENKTELFKQSRELAYQKALEKANQYAEFSGRKVGKVLTITEGASQDIAQTRLLMTNVRFEAAGGYFSDSSVPTGERGITSEINVTFLLE